MQKFVVWHVCYNTFNFVDKKNVQVDMTHFIMGFISFSMQSRTCGKNADIEKMNAYVKRRIFYSFFFKDINKIVYSVHRKISLLFK